MTRFLFLISLCLSVMGIQAQGWETVKSSKLFLYGEGYGASLDEADRQALSDLISKISVNISSVTQQKEGETSHNGKVETNSDFSSSIQTYSQATLTNTERVVLHNEPDAHVGRWIRKSEIQKIFESRKQKITELVDNAVKAEQSMKIDDALRNYYWALTLLRSLQYPNEMAYTDDNGSKHVMAVWIPEQMNRIFDNIKATAEKSDDGETELRFTYNRQPVASVDYSYFDGRDWSSIYSAKDGVEVIELPEGLKPKQYQIKYEFEYRGQAHIDKEIESVMNTVRSMPMKKAYASIKAAKENEATDESVCIAQQPQTNAMLELPEEGCQKYLYAIQNVASSIRRKNYDVSDELFTEEGKSIYNKLIKYGSAQIVGTPGIKVYQDGDNVVARGLQMAFSFKNGLRKSFVEDMVFTFDKDGKISNIAFGLGKTAEEGILSNPNWPETARKTIVSFMENYKTAYSLKRLDYIRDIFDDNAIIITGRVSKHSTMFKSREGSAHITNNDIITYNRQTKDEYLNNLARCFASNEFVNIRFSNTDVMKPGKGKEMYAIQIAQDYYSTNYGDHGYLFLEIDINNPQRPLIILRTWQPKKDPNFGIYGPSDF